MSIPLIGYVNVIDLLRFCYWRNMEWLIYVLCIFIIPFLISLIQGFVAWPTNEQEEGIKTPEQSWSRPFQRPKQNLMTPYIEKWAQQLHFLMNHSAKTYTTATSGPLKVACVVPGTFAACYSPCLHLPLFLVSSTVNPLKKMPPKIL